MNPSGVSDTTVEIIGDDQILADMLGVNERLLAWWKSEEMPIPEGVFFCASTSSSATPFTGSIRPTETSGISSDALLVRRRHVACISAGGSRSSERLFGVSRGKLKRALP